MNAKDQAAGRWLVALSISILILIGLLALVWAKANSAETRQAAQQVLIIGQQSELRAEQRELRNLVSSQVRNRAANVATWCDAINQSRDYDRHFVARVTRGHVRYGLSDLPCRRLRLKTLKSARP